MRAAQLAAYCLVTVSGGHAAEVQREGAFAACTMCWRLGESGISLAAWLGASWALAGCWLNGRVLAEWPGAG
jgi:hypothetical protein